MVNPLIVLTSSIIMLTSSIIVLTSSVAGHLCALDALLNLGLLLRCARHRLAPQPAPERESAGVRESEGE